MSTLPYACKQSLRLIELITCVMSSYLRLKQTTAACRPQPIAGPKPEQCNCGAPELHALPASRRQSGRHRHRRLTVLPSQPPPPPLQVRKSSVKSAATLIRQLTRLPGRSHLMSAQLG